MDAKSFKTLSPGQNNSENSIISSQLEQTLSIIAIFYSRANTLKFFTAVINYVP